MEFSSLISSIFRRERSLRLKESFHVDGTARNWYCIYLVDEIYPSWGVFDKPSSAPTNSEESVMNTAKESREKDIERFFGVFQGRFKILKYEFHE